MSRTQTDMQTLEEAAQLNREDSLLEGSLLTFPDFGQLVMTGDMHGHMRNFERVKNYADLSHSPARHVILHELIHAEHNGPIGDDHSMELVVAAARWKVEFPDQVHFIQSNHEMAQLTGKAICKGGRIVNYDFECSLAKSYGRHADDVNEALKGYIASFPLAARTRNRIFLSHSLPNKGDVHHFDPTIIERELTIDDMTEGGHAYMMVWGRHLPPEWLDHLAEVFDVDFFLSGHQPQEGGFGIMPERMIILASDHNHGAILPFDLKKTYTLDDLSRLVRPLASIA